MGAAVLPTIEKLKKEYVIVDIDPLVIEDLQQRDVPAEYGDAGNEDFLDYIRAHKAKLIISTIPDLSVSLDMIDHLKHKRSSAPIILTAKSAHEAAQLYDAGATFVILPNMLGGELFAQILKTKRTRKASWNVAAKKQKNLLGA